MIFWNFFTSNPQNNERGNWKEETFPPFTWLENKKWDLFIWIYSEQALKKQAENLKKKVTIF